MTFTLSTGCGHNRVVLEESVAIESFRIEQPQPFRGKDLTRGEDGNWAVDKEIIADIAFSRALENRIRAGCKLPEDRCFLDILNDLSELVINLGGEATVTDDAIEFFAHNVRGAEFIPWKHTRSFTIKPASYGSDMDIVFDRNLIQKDSIPIVNGRFRHRAMVRENNGQIKPKQFWLSMNITISAARRISIYSPGSRRPVSGFGIALKGVMVRIIGLVPLQSLVVVTEERGTESESRKVVAALEGLTVDKPPNAIGVFSEEVLDQWIADKREGMLCQKERTERPSDEEILAAVTAGLTGTQGNGNKESETAVGTLNIRQNATTLSLSISYWYITLLLIGIASYGGYRLVRPLAADLTRLTATSCFFVLTWGYIHFSTTIHKWVPLLSNMHLHGKK